MPIRRGILVSVGLIVALGLAQPAWATIDNLKSFKLAYPGKEAKAYSCKVCHQNPVGKKGDLNAYGVALQKLGAPIDPKKLTPEAYPKAEAEDSDGDGAANGDELKAGTDPADPKSLPSGAPASRQPVPTDALQAYLEQLILPAAWAAATSEQEGEAAGSEAAEIAEYVGTETCAACHTKEHQEFQHSTHARIAIPGDDVKAQGCEMCHGPGSLHAAAGGGRGVGGIINPRKDPSTCFACHLDKKMEFRRPYRHPVMEGKMSCAGCHNAHGAEVRPWSATTLKDINEACFKCHKDQRGPFVFEHEVLREGCTTCHQVHGSINQKMLVARDNNLCLRCHAQVNFPTIGNASHSGRFNEGTCFSGGCHTAPHGSNFDEHLRY